MCCVESIPRGLRHSLEGTERPSDVPCVRLGMQGLEETRDTLPGPGAGLGRGWGNPAGRGNVLYGRKEAGGRLYWCSRAAVTKSHTPGGLKHQKFIFSHF